MNNITTFDNYPPFATNGSRNMNTESAKYAVGFLEGETFPAEWANYLFHGATKGVSDLNTAVQSIWKENINVIQGSGQTPSSSDNTQLKTAIELMIQNAVLTANAQVLAQAKSDAQTFTNNAILTANAQVLAQAKSDAQTFTNNAISTANAQVLAQAKLDAHPVGSLYWSSDPTDPSTLFGGTWVRIKDRFIWAKGDSDTVNATGGAKTVQLTESNLPAHSHDYGWGGWTEVVNTDHTHNFSGSTNKVSEVSGQSANTGGMSDHSFGQFPSVESDLAKTGPFYTSDKRTCKFTGANYGSAEFYGITMFMDIAHTHNYDHYHNFSGTTGTCNGENYSIAHAHPYGGSGTTASVGSGTAHENMPPYIVKYCWERTA